MQATTLKSYDYKGFVIVYGLCDYHPNMWHVRDFRNYDEFAGSKATEICEHTLAKAKKAITMLLWAEENIPF